MLFHRSRRLIPLLLSVLAIGLWHGSSGEPAQAQAPSQKYPKLILIIRHAEKTGVKEDIHLSEPGKERAKQLPLLFEKSAKRTDPLPRPDFIFAAKDSKNSQRPRETVVHLAKQFKLPIDDTYHSTAPAKDPKAPGAAELRDELFKNPKYAGKTILISWRHGVLPELARTLKATNAPTKWGDEVYDRVWKITYDDAGKAEFVDLPQRLMPGDAMK
jgi:broad specificity phosphatase PhoE